MSSSVRSWQRSALVGLVAAFAVSLVTAGCSTTVDDNGQPTLDVDKARAKARAVSSAIYDMIGIDRGRATERGPAVSLCDEDPEHLYKTRHPSSVYGASGSGLKAGFQRLREELPKKGWKIVRYGPENSEAKSLASVHAVLMVSTPSNPREKEPLLSVTVASGCWRAPEGTDLGTRY
ncbi:hypothetical protein ACH4NF_30530 [Streptomyces sp. NPDC017248]|uniref:hypothetical protein n=1 Tax=unclassified Streptomyces TaxID=2593676 RepID=UPI0037AA31F0